MLHNMGDIYGESLITIWNTFTRKIHRVWKRKTKKYLTSTFRDVVPIDMSSRHRAILSYIWCDVFHQLLYDSIWCLVLKMSCTMSLSKAHHWKQMTAATQIAVLTLNTCHYTGPHIWLLWQQNWTPSRLSLTWFNMDLVWHASGARH